MRQMTGKYQSTTDPVGVRSRWASFQDRLGALLGCAPEARKALLSDMLTRTPAEATAYWLQLVVATGIATFGLVLDSTAVVIGAMLIAPLMTPIVGLGMGLAVGSPFLVLRSAGRVLLSISVAIGGAAIITKLLPFNELTSEIAARTTPTALDLFTAAFCAVAGAYASMRPGSGTAATAAGTSIGISLVPPLCASGYGVGTAQWEVARGAALLFTANFAAIVVVCTIAFVAAGFNRLNVAELEARELARAQGEPIARAIALRLAGIFASPGGPVMRLLLPFALLAAVYFPLRHALDQVAWQIRVRSAVNEALAPLLGHVVQSKLRVERGEVELKLLLIGTTDQAEGAQSDLTFELAKVAGVTPLVEVVAVPDARALSGLAARLLDAPTPVKTEPPAPAPGPQLLEAHARIREKLDQFWPSTHAGALAAAWFYPGSARVLKVAVTHIGTPLDAVSRESVSRALKISLDQTVELIDLPIPGELELSDSANQMEAFERAVERARSTSAIALCMEEPEVPPEVPPEVQRRRELNARSVLAERLHGAVEGLPNVTWLSGPAWRARFTLGSCRPTPEPSTSPPP